MLMDPPPDVDPRSAAKALVVFLEESAWSFGRSFKRLPAPVIRATLGVLARSKSPWATFLRAHVGHSGDGELVAAWNDALAAMRDLNIIVRFGSTKHREKIEGVAQDERSVEAARAVAASRSKAVPRNLLAVLLVDGSEASIDALLPTLDRASTERDRELDKLVGMARFAAKKEPRLKALLEGAEQTKEERAKTSPVLAIGKVMFGDDAPEELWFHVTVGSDERRPGNDMARWDCHIEVDSRAARPFRVTLFDGARLDGPSTSFELDTTDDGLKVGRCNPLGVPAYLARLEKKLGTSWNWPDAVIETGLRGRKRARLVWWLSST